METHIFLLIILFFLILNFAFVDAGLFGFFNPNRPNLQVPTVSGNGSTNYYNNTYNNYYTNCTNCSHNNLSGLQGGSPDEYYHINQSIYDYIIANIYTWINSTTSWIIDTTNGYLFNSSDTVYFNDTLLNLTIDNRALVFNETLLILNVNSSRAGIGDCPLGEVVMNTTAGGVECIAISSSDSWASNYTYYYNKSQIDNNLSLYLLITDERYNDTAIILSLNTTENIQALSFYNKSEVDNNFSLYYLASNPNNYINTSGGDSWAGNYTNYYNKLEIDNNFSLYLLLTDERFNETDLINSINTTANIQALSFYNKSQVDANLSLYLARDGSNHMLGNLNLSNFSILMYGVNVTPTITTVGAGYFYILNNSETEGYEPHFATAGLDYDLTGGGGGCTNLPCLTDIDDSLAYTSGVVLISDGSTFFSRKLNLTDLDDYTTFKSTLYNRTQVWARNETYNKSEVDNNLSLYVDLTSPQIITGIKNFSSYPFLPVAYPTLPNQAVNKLYVDSFKTNVTYKNAVLNFSKSVPPASPSVGDRYRVKPIGSSAWTELDNQLVEWDGADWVSDGTSKTGWVVLTLDEIKQYAYDEVSSNWLLIGTSTIYTASDGVKLISSNFQADYDGTSISTANNHLRIVSGGINNTHIASASVNQSQLTSDILLFNETLRINSLNTTILTKALAGNCTAGKAIQNSTINGVECIDVGTGGGASWQQNNVTTMDIDIISSPQTAQTWTNQPAAITELFGNTYNRIYVDLTTAQQVRLVERLSVVGATNAYIYAQYSTNKGSTWANLSSTNNKLPINATATTTNAYNSSWTSVAYQGEVLLRIVGVSPAISTGDPAWRQLRMQFKVAAINTTVISSGGSQWQSTATTIYNATSGVKVGIGTATPTAKLSVSGNASISNTYEAGSTGEVSLSVSNTFEDNAGEANEPVYGIKSSGTLTDTGAQFAEDTIYSGHFTGTGEINDIVYGLYSTASGGATNWAGYFDAGDVYIKNKLGVGTTAPTYPLDVKGQVYLNNTLFVNTTGRVGIGTIAPTYTLDVSGLGLNVSNSTNTAKFCLNGVCYTSLTAGSSPFSTGANTIYNATAKARLGMGTTAPAYVLDIRGNVSLNSSLYVTDSGKVGIGVATPLSQLAVTGSGDIFTVYSGTNYALNVSATGVKLGWDSGDNFGSLINIPVVNLAAGSTTARISFRDASSTYTKNLDFDGSGFLFNDRLVVANNFTVNTSDLFVNAKLARVGIGTNKPTDTLNVVGTTNLTSDVYIRNKNVTTTSVWKTVNLVGGFGKGDDACASQGGTCVGIGEVNCTVNEYLAGGQTCTTNFTSNLGVCLATTFPGFAADYATAICAKG